MKAIRVANAPCSWGVLEFEQTEKKSGFSQVLDEMAQAGYEGTELGDWGFMPSEPKPLKAELTKRGLDMVGAFVPIFLAEAGAHAEGRKTAVRTAGLIAAVASQPFLVLSDDNNRIVERTQCAGRIRPEQGLSADAWRTFCRGAQEVAKAVLEATGVRTVFHHHCGGYVETPQEIDTLLNATDPKLLGLCLDTGHYAFGGGDPSEAMRRFGDRIWHVHYKDCQPDIAARSRKESWDYFASLHHGIFCELGKGSVDFAGITSGLRQRGYQGWIVVEQDVLPGMGSPLQCAIRNRDFLKKLEL